MMQKIFEYLSADAKRLVYVQYLIFFIAVINVVIIDQNINKKMGLPALNQVLSWSLLCE